MSGWAEALARFTYFRGLNNEQREALAGSVQETSLSPGTTLFREGDPPLGLCLLHRGALQLKRSSPEGKEHIVRILQAGDVFGEVMLFDQKPCPATAIAVEASLVGIMRRDGILRLVRDHPEIALAIMGIMAERLRHLQSRLAAQSLLDATGRVATIILELAGNSDGDGETPENLRVKRPPGQAQVGAMAGVSRETASRVLGHLQKTGVLRVEEDGSWTVQNGTALRSWVLPED